MRDRVNDGGKEGDEEGEGREEGERMRDFQFLKLFLRWVGIFDF